MDLYKKNVVQFYKRHGQYSRSIGNTPSAADFKENIKTFYFFIFFVLS